MLPLTKGHLSNKDRIAWQTAGVSLLEGDYCMVGSGWLSRMAFDCPRQVTQNDFGTATSNVCSIDMLIGQCAGTSHMQAGKKTTTKSNLVSWVRWKHNSVYNQNTRLFLAEQHCWFLQIGLTGSCFSAFHRDYFLTQTSSSPQCTFLARLRNFFHREVYICFSPCPFERASSSSTLLLQ